jgi:DNA-binding NarL/FixJ family response regulator
MRILKLLVIDTNKTVREKIAGILSGHEKVRAVCQMAEFVDVGGIVREFRPHAVLIDLSLAAAHAHSLGVLRNKNSDVEFIVICEDGWDLFQDSEAASRLHADHIIDKARLWRDMDPVLENLAAATSRG